MSEPKLTKNQNKLSFLFCPLKDFLLVFLLEQYFRILLSSICSCPTFLYLTELNSILFSACHLLTLVSRFHFLVFLFTHGNVLSHIRMYHNDTSIVSMCQLLVWLNCWRCGFWCKFYIISHMCIIDVRPCCIFFDNAFGKLNWSISIKG